MSAKMKNRAAQLMDLLSRKTAKANEIVKRALDVPAADGTITTDSNGNIHKKPDQIVQTASAQPADASIAGQAFDPGAARR
jgi:protein involved in polysaccharide export with SLBB domain